MFFNPPFCYAVYYTKKRPAVQCNAAIGYGGRSLP